MAYSFHVSLQNTEKKLADWIQEKIRKGEISPSLIFRDAMKELKKFEDISNSENPVELHKRIRSLQEIVRKQGDFIDSKKLMEHFMKFDEKQKLKGNFAKKNIEVIEIQNQKRGGENLIATPPQLQK